MVDTYEHKVGPRNGARVIARAWADAAFKQRLLADGAAALKELGYGGAQGEDTLVVEVRPRVHNLVVCTLLLLSVALLAAAGLGTSPHPIARAR